MIPRGECFIQSVDATPKRVVAICRMFLERVVNAFMSHVKNATAPPVLSDRNSPIGNLSAVFLHWQALP